jgi:uncharacterized protein YndB with AHSA1/START domain
MKEKTVVHATYEIERSYPVPPQRVFAAFADPAKKLRWFREEGKSQTLKFDMDFCVGGREHSQFRVESGPIGDVIFTNDTVYQDIVPNSRIVIAYTMAMGERRISASLATFEMLPEGTGTKLVFTEQGAFFEGSDGPKMREDGWRLLLERLGDEVGREQA